MGGKSQKLPSAVSPTAMIGDTGQELRVVLESAPEHAPIGVRWNAAQVLEAEWLNVDVDLRSRVMAIEKADTLRYELDRRVDRAMMLRAFVAEHPTAEDAFEALTGRPPAHRVQMIARSYGICIIGHTEDLQLLHPKMGAKLRPTGISSSPLASIPELRECICLSNYMHQDPDEPSREIECEPQDAATKTAEHELMHAYLTLSPVENIALQHVSSATRTAIFSQRRDPSNLATEYINALSQYANGMLKHEMLARVHGDPSSLLDEYPIRGPLDSSYVFGSLVYSLAPLYAAINDTHCPKDPREGALFRERRDEMGWPYNDAEFPDELSYAVEEMRAALRKDCKQAEEPYSRAYEESARLMKQLVRNGMPALQLADIVIATDFLDIPEALSKLAA